MALFTNAQSCCHAFLPIFKAISQACGDHLFPRYQYHPFADVILRAGSTSRTERALLGEREGSSASRLTKSRRRLFGAGRGRGGRGGRGWRRCARRPPATCSDVEPLPARLLTATSDCLPSTSGPLPAACGCLGGSRYAEQCEALRLRSSDRGLDRTPPYIGRGGSGRWPRPRPRQCPLISSNKFGLLSVRPVSPTPSPFLSPSSWFPEQPRPRPLWKGKGLPVRAGVCCCQRVAAPVCATRRTRPRPVLPHNAPPPPHPASTTEVAPRATRGEASKVVSCIDHK